MLMERCYPPTPVCLPCRASLASGQYPSTHGATHNHTQLAEDHPILFGRTFSDAGYRTHIVGKSHFSNCHDPLSQESAPFIHNRNFYRHWHGPWYGFQRADISIGHTVEKHACGMHYGAWLEDQGVDLAAHFGHHDYTAYGPWSLPEQYHSSRWVADTTIAGLDEALERGQPYLGWVNFQDPHNPCLVPEPWASMYDPAAIPRYGFKPGEPACYASKPPFYAEILAQPGAYAAKPSDPDLPGAGNVCHLAWTPEQIQANAACYYGMISLLDHHVGRILDHLDARGIADNTLIVFTADHGELLGDHGYWFKSLVSYDESIRVPFLVAGPGIPRGARNPALMNLIDCFPTFCDYAGLPIPWDCEGVDQRPAWEDADVAVRSAVIVEERPGDSAWNQRIIVAEQWKLAYYAGRAHGELYDMNRDPQQIVNLWDEPGHALIKDRLIRRILDHEMNKARPTPGPGAAQAWR
jgi:arylsulfatase A-like enzyme